MERRRVCARRDVNLGIAIDLEKKDGTRTLLVPNIKNANKLHFSEFLEAYDDVVKRARNGKLQVSDFQGTTISLTNPGTIGTVASTPRLMAGQSVIIATGAIEYPAEYQAMAPAALSQLGHQQSDHDQQHLRSPHHSGRRVRCVSGARS